MEGSFHSATLSKVCGQLVGYVTEATFGHPCVGGEAWALNGIERLPNGTIPPSTLPWHIRYNGFTGTLPNITGIRLQLIGVSFLMRTAGGAGCLMKTTEARPAFGIVERNTTTGNIEGLRPEESTTIPTLTTLEGLCAALGFQGRARVFLQGVEPVLEQTRIVVRLIQ
jgi:hypothetical protein